MNPKVEESVSGQSGVEQFVVKRSLFFILLTVFIYSIGFGIIMPVLPALIMELEGVGLAEATKLGAYVGASYAIAQFLMGPLIGNISDRFGRRPVFLFSLLGFGIDFLLMGLSQSVIWLFVGRAVAGGFGAIFGPANSAIADFTPPEKRAQHFGYVGATFGIGFIVGPALGGLLATIDLRLPFFVAGALALLTAFYGYWAFPESLAQDKRRQLTWSRANPIGAFISAIHSLSQERGLLTLAAAYFAWVCATNIYPSSWTFYSRAAFGWDTQMVGISLTVVGISMAFTQAVLLKRMIERFRECVTAMLGIMISIVFFVLLAIGIPGSLVMTLTFFMGVQGVILPSINAMMSQRVSAKNQGQLQGFNGSLAALALLIAQLSYNSLLSFFTAEDAPLFFPGAPFVLAILFALIALSILLRQKIKGSHEQA